MHVVEFETADCALHEVLGEHVLIQNFRAVGLGHVRIKKHGKEDTWEGDITASIHQCWRATCTLPFVVVVLPPVDQRTGAYVWQNIEIHHSVKKGETPALVDTPSSRVELEECRKHFHPSVALRISEVEVLLPGSEEPS